MGAQRPLRRADAAEQQGVDIGKTTSGPLTFPMTNGVGDADRSVAIAVAAKEADPSALGREHPAERHDPRRVVVAGDGDRELGPRLDAETHGAELLAGDLVVVVLRNPGKSMHRRSRVHRAHRVERAAKRVDLHASVARSEPAPRDRLGPAAVGVIRLVRLPRGADVAADEHALD